MKIRIKIPIKIRIYAVFYVLLQADCTGYKVTQCQPDAQKSLLLRPLTLELFEVSNLTILPLPTERTFECRI